MIKYLLKLIVSLALLAWLLWSGEIQLLSFQQLAIHKPYLILILADQGALLLLAAARWRLLTRAFSMKVSFFRILQFILMGEFFSLFFLGSVGGDLSRVIFLGSSDPQRKVAAVLTVLLDKAMALWVLCGIGLTALLSLGPASGTSPWVISMKLILAAPLLGLPVALLLFRWTPGFLLSLASKLANPDGLLLLRTQLQNLSASTYFKVGLLNLTAQSLLVFNFICCGFALGVFNVPLFTYLLVVPLGFIALAMPLSIGGLGVGQLAFAELFKFYGVTEEGFGSNSSTLHIAVWAVYALFGGLAFALSRPKRP